MAIDEKLLDEMNQKIEEVLKPLPPSQQPQPITTELSLPTPDDFKRFYSDYLMYKTPLIPELSNNVLTLKNTTPNARPIQIGIYGIVEVLSDKYNQHVSQFYKNGAKSSPLPDFEFVHAKLEEEIRWIGICFTDILSYSDPRIIQMCKDYHRIQSAPLTLRLRFYEFEKSLLAVKIENAIADELKENNEKVRQIERDYADKFEKTKIGFQTQLNESKKAVEKYRWIAKDLQEDLETTQTKISSIKDESSLTAQKLIDTEAKIEELDRLYSDAKLKYERLEKELKRFTEQPWRTSSNSIPEKPTFINVVTGQVIKFPENFKTTHTIDRKDGEDFIYVDISGKEFRVPESLELKFRELTNPTTMKVNDKQKQKQNLTPNEQKILEVLYKSNGIPLDAEEIADETGIDINHVYAYLKNMAAKGITKDIIDDEGVKGYLVS